LDLPVVFGANEHRGPRALKPTFDVAWSRYDLNDSLETGRGLHQSNRVIGICATRLVAQHVEAARNIERGVSIKECLSAGHVVAPSMSFLQQV